MMMSSLCSNEFALCFWPYLVKLAHCMFLVRVLFPLSRVEHFSSFSVHSPELGQ